MGNIIAIASAFAALVLVAYVTHTIEMKLAAKKAAK